MKTRVICLHCGADSYVEWPATLLIRGDEKCGPCGKPAKIVLDYARKNFHTTIRDAEADGWLNCYVGNRGRIYGQKKNDHRVWRSFK